MSQRVFVRNLGGTPIVVNALEVGDAVTGGRETLEADRTFYVRTDGSDSNDGSANTAGSAFLTVQFAVNTAVALDLSIYQVTIQITGTFDETVTLKSYIGNGPITILGDSAVPTAGTFRIGGATGDAIDAFSVLGDWVLSGIEIISGNGWGLQADFGSVIRLKNVRFGACANAQVVAFNNAVVTNIQRDGSFGTAFAISGNASWWMFASQQGFISVQAATITLTGTPAYSQQTVACDTNSTFIAASNTFSGSATGTRFSVSNGAVIYTNGGGANYFPGNAAGTGTNFSASPYGLYV